MLQALRRANAPKRAETLQGSARAQVAIDINAAFDFVARDYFRNCRLWQPQIVELRPLGPEVVSPGAKAQQTTFDRGMRSEWLFEVSTIDPPHHFVLNGISEPIRLFYEFSGVRGDATEVIFGFEAMLMLPLRPFAASIHASLQQGTEQSVTNLKRVLESHATPNLSVNDFWQAARNHMFGGTSAVRR